MAGMIRRIVAAVLWFSAGWYLGAELALVLSLSPLLGPMLGGAAAIFIVTSPGRIMWRTRSRTQRSTVVQAATGLVAADQRETG